MPESKAELKAFAYVTPEQIVNIENSYLGFCASFLIVLGRHRKMSRSNASWLKPCYTTENEKSKEKSSYPLYTDTNFGWNLRKYSV